MNPFSKRIRQIKNPDLDLRKGTRNPFLDLKSVFGFTERNTPLCDLPKELTDKSQVCAVELVLLEYFVPSIKTLPECLVSVILS